MKLRWEQPSQGMCRGFSEDGHQLAQVANIHGPDGTDRGWMVWLVYQHEEPFDHYRSVEEAKAAAEAALDIQP